MRPGGLRMLVETKRYRHCPHSSFSELAVENRSHETQGNEEEYVYKSCRWIHKCIQTEMPQISLINFNITSHQVKGVGIDCIITGSSKHLSTRTPTAWISNINGPWLHSLLYGWVYSTRNMITYSVWACEFNHLGKTKASTECDQEVPHASGSQKVQALPT